MRKLVCCLALLTFASSAWAQRPAPGRSNGRELAAQQIRYDRHPVAGGVQVDSAWVEPDGTPRSLVFRLPQPAMTDEARALVPPDAQRQRGAGLAAAEAEAQRVPQGVSLRVIPQPSGMKVAASGPAGIDLGEPINRVSQAYQQAVDRAIQSSGYVRRSEHLIEPDYVSLVARQTALLRNTGQDMARALSGLTPRDRVAVLLGFVQSVPYSTLHARDASALRTPAGVLAEDRGDCDEKSMTLATLLAITDPALSSVLVFDDVHAFMGISLPVQPGDIAVNVGGRSYVMLEPVGPGWFPVGHLSGMSQGILRKPNVRAVVVTGQ
jgi:hypothetical protein